MVVRFPSDPFGGEQGAARTDESGLPGGEHLAPVTPLRRPTPRDGGAPGPRHPAGTGRSGATARPEPAGEVIELPGAAQGTDTSRWNNTWGDEGHPAASRSDSRDAPTPPEEAELDGRSTAVSAVVIRQLARRGMSRWEVEQVLLKREIEPEAFGPELDRLEALGVIDDASLAISLAFTQHSRKGLGRSSIEHDLTRRHIDPELVEIALADIADADELERATELATKRLGQLSSYDEETARRRLHGFLARKGYSSSVVRQAMDAAFASRGRGGVRFR